MGWGSWAFAVGFAVGVAGCSAIPASVQQSKSFAGTGGAYGRTLEPHIRKVELYDGFETVAKGWATWRSPELREALAMASARAYGLGEAESEQMRNDELREAGRAREFHLALYTPLEDLNDLDLPGTLWRAYLELPGGERLNPLKVTHVKKSEKVPVVYPYVSPWTREYLLSFPVGGDREPPDHSTLVLTGPLGTMSFPF